MNLFVKVKLSKNFSLLFAISKIEDLEKITELASLQDQMTAVKLQD